MPRRKHQRQREIQSETMRRLNRERRARRIEPISGDEEDMCVDGREEEEVAVVVGEEIVGVRSLSPTL